jgi:hypothetical protein
MTPDEFARALRANEVDQRVVIVDGRVVRGQLSPQQCSPGYGQQPCELGVLEGVDPVINVYTSWRPTPNSQSTETFDDPYIDWPYWWLPSPPVEGPLLLFARGGGVTYAGRVHKNAERVTWSLADVKAVDPGSLSPDDTLLVDGWLTGVTGLLDCDPLSTERVAGLPDRSCANPGWLFDRSDRSVESDADRASGIEVQHNAYYQFAPGPQPQLPLTGEPVPRRGIYALAPSLEAACDDGQPQCWKWSMVGLLQADASTVSTRTISCGHITFAIASPAESLPTKPEMTLIDETGLIRACIATFAPPENEGVLVESSQPSAFDVSWPATECDSATFTFRSTDFGYELNGQTVTQPCPGTRMTRQRLMLMLNQGLAPGSLHVSVDGVGGASPTQAPSLPASVIPCRPDEHQGTVIDETGYIDACRTVTASGMVAAVTVADFYADGEAGVRVLWTGSACDTPIFYLSPAALRYTLKVDIYGEQCGGSDIPHEVQFLLNTDLSAAVIDATLRRLSGPAPIPSAPPPAASADFDTSVGTFTISAHANKAIYAAGEAIMISGEIVWHGGATETVEIIGDESDATDAVVHFGWEQLDGDLLVAARFKQSCRSIKLEAGVPMTASFAKETGNFGDTQHDAFWHDYFATPELMLPPGRYRVMARAEFSVGECSRENRVVLYVPIFIVVTA